MAQTFGILLAGTHTNLAGAESPAQIVPIFVRKAIEHLEGITIPLGRLKLEVQKYVDGYGEVVVENQWNDCGEVKYPVVSIGEVADHLMSQGWITANRKSIDNRLVSQMIHDWMKENGIRDYDGSLQFEDVLTK